MTTRRELLLAAAALAALPAAAESTFTPTWTGFCGMPNRMTWLLTQWEIEDTPHWRGPSVVPSLLDVVAYHKCLPRCERPALLEDIRARFQHPRLAVRADAAYGLFLVVVGEHDDVSALERSWNGHDSSF